MSDDLAPRPPLPIGAIRTRASGWWGLWFLLMSESAAFAYIFFTYYYYSVQPPADWIPGPPPDLKYALPQTWLVLVGCLFAWGAARAVAREARWLGLAGLVLNVLFGAAFITLQFEDWFSKSFTFSTSTYSSVYFLISGFHLTHFVIGWLMFILLSVWTALGYFDRVRHAPVTIGAVYWYFLATSWLAVFFVLYGTPYLFRGR